MALERDNKLLPESCLRNCVKEVRVSLPFDATSN